MTTPSEPHELLRRYLTPFYGFTLGLALVLAIIASIPRGNVTPGIATVTQTVVAPAISPTQGSIQKPDKVTPTPLPAIPATPNEQTPSPLGVSAAELRGITVNLWLPWTGSTSAALLAIVDEFNRTNRWGITVLVKGFEGFGSLDDAVEIALTSDALPDVPSPLPDVLVDYSYQARHWDVNNLFVDLRAYLDDPVWGFTPDEQADYYRGFWAEDAVYDDGGSLTKRLGIPFYRSAYVMFYNQSWGHELGYLNPPTTIEEFRERACAAADELATQGDKSVHGKGGWLITPQPGALVGWMYAFGGSITNPSGLGYRFDTPETRQTFEYLKGLQASGCAWSEAGVDAQSTFASRQALFVVGSLSNLAAQQEAFILAGNPDDWVVIPFPSDSKQVVSSYGPALLLTHSTPARQLAAWLVIKWLVYPPNQADWVRALEAYPTRASTMDYLTEATSTSPQWAEALELLHDTHSEPSLASWSVVRWVLNDVMTQLFDPQFTAEQIPSLLENLDNVAAEILTQRP